VKRSTWQHLRIPFSIYLLPVFCFAISQAPRVDLGRTLLIAVILHLLAYPASQAFNSYYDRDEGSIGGLEKPPPVTRELLVVALAFDGLALLLGLLVGWRFSALLLAYGLASKAYSHPGIRLKARPWLGWLTVAFFQGGFTYAMVTLGLGGLDFGDLASARIVYPAALSSLLIGGAYPMTQIYQHDEDATRGDLTLSRLLGLRGTFVFCGVALAVAALGFFGYFRARGQMQDFWLMLLFLAPLAVYVQRWFVRVKRDQKQANFRSAMTLNRLSAFSLISYFTVLTLLHH
jgi:1,4-dihydroxy-2-naphthoate octaprenyltransferase